MHPITSLREYFSLRSNLFGDLFFLLLMLAVLIFPFDKTFASLPVNLSAIACLLLLITAKREHWKNMKPFLVSALAYVVFLYAYAIADNKLSAFYDTRGKASLLLAPLLMGYAVELSRKHVATLLILFVFSCWAMSVSAVSVALYKYFILHETAFYYKDLVSFTTIHPAYLGMYISFSIVIIIITLLQNIHSFSAYKKAALLALTAWFFFFILLLTAKTSIIFSVIFLNGIFFYYGWKNKKLQKTILTAVFINGVGIALMFSMSVTKERITLLLQAGNAGYENSVESRTIIWRTVIDHAETFWLKGVGNGNDTDILVNFYKEAGFEKGVAERYNTHNQFLQVWLVSGIFGLLLFCAVFLYQLHYAWKRNDNLYFFFLLLCVVNSLTESVFEVQSGVLFFALFNTFFLRRNIQ